MHLDNIKFFHAVVEAKGFSAAARLLDLPKAKISRKVIQLEEEIGATLLTRTTRSVKPTQQGLHFYKKTKEMYAELIQLTEEVTGDEKIIDGKLRIQLPPESKILMPYIQEFQLQYPGIELDLLIDSQDINLVERGIDITIKVGQQPDSNLICRKVDSINRVVLASPRYLERHSKLDKMEHLSLHNCLRFRRSNNKVESYWPIDKKGTLVEINGNLISNDTGLLLEATLLGQGIAYLPRLLCKKYIENAELKILFEQKQPYSEDIWLLYPQNRYKSHVLKILIDFILNATKH